MLKYSLVIFLLLKIYFEAGNIIYDNQIDQKLLSEMNPQTDIESNTLDETNGNFHYYVSGKIDAPLLVFVHPAFADHRVFNSQVDFFSKNYRVITVDLIGHGMSQPKNSTVKIDRSADYMNNLMENEGYESAHFIGLSLGSLVIQQFKDLYPKKVSSLTVVGGYDIHKTNDQVNREQNKTKFGALLRAIFSMKAFRRHATSIATHSPKGELQFYAATSRYTRKSFRVMSGVTAILESQQGNVTPVPLLLMIGEHDVDIAKSLVHEWHKRNSETELIEVKDAGHCINLDQPEQFNKTLLNFLTNIEKDKLK